MSLTPKQKAWGEYKAARREDEREERLMGKTLMQMYYSGEWRPRPVTQVRRYPAGVGRAKARNMEREFRLQTKRDRRALKEAA